jgi:hypothetical protein
VVVGLVIKRQVSILTKDVSSGDPKFDKAIQGLRQAVRSASFLDGARVIEDVELFTAAYTKVAHGLGRRPVGYAVARVKTAPSAAFSLYDANDGKSDLRNYIYLRSVGANVTVDLLVY